MKSTDEIQKRLVRQVLAHNCIICLHDHPFKEDFTLYVVRSLSARKKSIIVVDEKSPAWCLEAFAEFKPGIWNGSTNSDSIYQEFKEIWSSCDIIIMYGESLVALLEYSLIALSDVSVVVVDECQNALIKTHPYFKIRFQLLQSNMNTRFLGFAKTLGCKDMPLLEDAFRAKVYNLDSKLNLRLQTAEQNIEGHESAISGLTGEAAIQLVCWYLALSRSKNLQDPFQNVNLDQIMFESAIGRIFSCDPQFVYSCTFTFSGQSKIIYGSLEATAELAKSSAALETCKFLLENGALDQSLLPVVDNMYFYESRQQVDPAVVDYIEKIIPNQLSRFDENHEEFYLTILDVGTDQSDYIFKTHAVAIATPDSINGDCIPPIPLWISKSRVVNVVLLQYSETPVKFSPEPLAILQSCQPLFWNYVFQGVDEKFDPCILKFDQNLYYYVLPMVLDNGAWTIDWDLMKSQYEHMTLHDFLSKLATLCHNNSSYDNIDFSAVLNLEGDTLDFTLNVIDSNFMQFLKKALSELDISCLEYLYTDLEINFDLCKDDRVNNEIKTAMDVFYGSRGFQLSHPVLFAVVGNRRRSLKQHRFNLKHFKDSFQNFLLDTCYVVPLPKLFVDQLHLLPTVVTVIDMHCTVDQFYHEFNIAQLPRQIIFPAFIAPSINYGTDYQRLESLGDSVLKLATTTFFYQYYHKDEHFITKNRGYILSNANLCVVARRFGLGKYLITRKPTLNTFAPPFMARKKCATPSFVSVKTLADFMEALIGAYFEYDYMTCWDFMEYFGLVPSQASVWSLISKHSSHSLHLHNDYSDFEPLEKVLGYKFNSPGLLSIALSLPGYEFTSYQRLECLGDAVLEALVMKYFYLEYPEANPGKLHDLKIHAVNAEIFNRISYSLGLHNFVRGEFEEDYEPYFEYLASLSPLDLPTLTEIDGPKVLGDLFEAVVGAIFVDLSGDLDSTWKIVKKLLNPFLDLYASFDSVTISPISEFFLAMSSLGLNSHSMLLGEEYRIVGFDNGVLGSECILSINKEILATGTGNTKRLAKHNAYRMATKQVKTLFET